MPMLKFKGIEFEETYVVGVMYYEGLTFEEAVLSYKARKKLPAGAFCGPNRSYPAHDAAHVRNALARLAQFGHRLKAKVRARVLSCLRSKAKRFKVKVGKPKKKAKVEETVAWFITLHKDEIKESD